MLPPLCCGVHPPRPLCLWAVNRKAVLFDTLIISPLKKLYEIARHISKMKSCPKFSFQRGSWFCILCHGSLTVHQFILVCHVSWVLKVSHLVTKKKRQCSQTSNTKVSVPRAHYGKTDEIKSQQSVCRVQWEKLSFPLNTIIRKLTEKLFCWVFVLLKPIPLSGI